MKRFLNTTDVRKLTGASVRQLNHWDAIGLIRPSVQSAQGTGSRRLYSFADAVRLAVALALRDQDVGLETIRTIVACVAKCLKRAETMGGAGFVVVAGRFTHVVDSADAVPRHIGSAPVSIVVDVGRVASGLADHPPITRSTRVGGQTCQVAVRHDPRADRFEATCRELPDAVGLGRTVDDAVQALQQHLEGPPPAAREDSPRPTSSPASSWGYDW
jgi:DNA-binding transcriptional MerR regulator